jgi:predicted RNA-binding protein
MGNKYCDWDSIVMANSMMGELTQKEETTCETDAHLTKEREEELILESIMFLRPEDGEIYLQNISGEQKQIKTRIKDRIILEEI